MDELAWNTLSSRNHGNNAANDCGPLNDSHFLVHPFCNNNVGLRGTERLRRLFTFLVDSNQPFACGAVDTHWHGVASYIKIVSRRLVKSCSLLDGERGGREERAPLQLNRRELSECADGRGPCECRAVEAPRKCQVSYELMWWMLRLVSSAKKKGLNIFKEASKGLRQFQGTAFHMARPLILPARQ